VYVATVIAIRVSRVCAGSHPDANACHACGLQAGRFAMQTHLATTTTGDWCIEHACPMPQTTLRKQHGTPMPLTLVVVYVTYGLTIPASPHPTIAANHESKVNMYPSGQATRNHAGGFCDYATQTLGCNLAGNNSPQTREAGVLACQQMSTHQQSSNQQDQRPAMSTHQQFPHQQDRHPSVLRQVYTCFACSTAPACCVEGLAHGVHVKHKGV
jgi:hypothetical protein